MAKSAVSGNGVELRTDLDLPKRLDRVAVDSLETASIGRQHAREKVTIVAQELDNVSEVATSSALESMLHANLWP